MHADRITHPFLYFELSYPVATQPGRSGENADRLFGVFSMTIKNFVDMVLVFKSGLPKDAVERAGSNVILRMTGNRNPPRFCRMFILAVAALFDNHHPTVIFDYTLNVSNSHGLPILRSSNGRFLRHRPERSDRVLNSRNSTNAGPRCQTGKVCRRLGVKTSCTAPP